MRKFLMENYDNLDKLTAVVLMLLFISILFVSYAINKENYKKIVKLYEKRFGCLPEMARLARDASLLAISGYHAKVGFIMGSLILPYNRVTNHDMSIEAYNFIRNLPGELTTGFKVEAILWILSTFNFLLIIFIEIMI